MSVRQQCKKCEKYLSIKNGWKSVKNPKRYHTYCKKCNNKYTYESMKKLKKENPEKYKKRYDKWVNNNRDRYREIKRESYQRIKERAFKKYSHGKLECRCCGEKIFQFLSIDHVNNDGAKHRELLTRKKRSKNSGAGQAIYSWLVRNRYQKGFQILCMNCNWGKRLTGICPHKIKTNFN